MHAAALVSKRPHPTLPAAAFNPFSCHQPLSLEELLNRRKAEQAAQARPVFLTKEQRAKQALEKRVGGGGVAVGVNADNRVMLVAVAAAGMQMTGALAAFRCPADQCPRRSP